MLFLLYSLMPLIPECILHLYSRLFFAIALEFSSDSSIAGDGTATAFEIAGAEDASFVSSVLPNNNTTNPRESCTDDYSSDAKGRGGRGEEEEGGSSTTRAAALEEMVADLVEQKVHWAEHTSSLEAQLKARSSRSAHLEQDLAAKDETLDVMASQQERDAGMIRTLEQK